jgi:glycosyltransferase involved in cell wall biosynthesis
MHKKINCLHICNDYLGSKVHRSLYNGLVSEKIDQTVFHALKDHNTHLSKEFSDYGLGYKVHFSKTLKHRHRILFRAKSNFLYQDLRSKINLKNIDVVHATTLFSDGYLAYKLFKKEGIPYVVCIRSTDINVFLKLRPDLYWIGKKILLNASKVIFLTPALLKQFQENKLGKRYTPYYEDKMVLLPNGIDEYWINHITQKKKEIPKKIIYVGSFLHRKNVNILIDAFLLSLAKHPNLVLTIVGSKGPLEDYVIEKANEHQNINYLGQINSLEGLREQYLDGHIFALPSQGETFGLVYLEALSQGLPILYVKDEGVYGLLNYDIGEALENISVNNVITALDKLLSDYDKYDFSSIDFTKFSWKKIGESYIDLFFKAMENKK